MNKKFVDVTLTLVVGTFFTLVIFALSVYLSTFVAAASPLPQDPGQQVDVFAGTVITTTAQTATTACGQGAGSVGRKTLSVINESGGGVITVTAELRVTSVVSNHTTGHLAVNLLAAGSASSDTTTPDEASGRFCQVSAISDGTSTITVTLRRE